jgi:hypothetical protein
MSRYFIFILFYLCGFSAAVAQKGYELGAWIGTSFYYGDLNTKLGIKKPGIAGGIIGKYNFDTRISLKASINYANVGGADSLSDNVYERNRNLSFRSHIFDFTSNLELNFLHYYHGSSENYYTPYLLIGFSIFHYTPQAQLDNQWHNLRALGTEGQELGNEYGSMNAAFTLGFGFKYDLTRDLSLNIQLSTHRTFADYLDDVSTVYADNSIIANRRGPIAAALADRSLNPDIGLPGRQRGHSQNNDVYNMFSIGILRYFGGLECPEISKDW